MKTPKQFKIPLPIVLPAATVLIIVFKRYVRNIARKSFITGYAVGVATTTVLAAFLWVAVPDAQTPSKNSPTPCKPGFAQTYKPDNPSALTRK